VKPAGISGIKRVNIQKTKIKHATSSMNSNIRDLYGGRDAFK
jgi:hypothetical protein